MAKTKYVTGVPSVQRVFRAYSREAQREIENALIRSANDVADTAEQLVPEDEGDLANTIEVQKPGAGRVARAVIGGGRGGVKGKALVYVVAGTTKETAQAAYRSEFGRSGGPDGHPGHEAQPFMLPAYWQNRDKVIRRINTALRKVARRVTRRGK